jgi:tetratricopeptide (TPR) repeat protein
MNQGIRDEYILPQWLPFKIAAQQRETGTFQSKPIRINYGPAQSSFIDQLDDFKLQPSVYLGSELMGIADVIGFKDIAQELAYYVLNEESAGPVAHEQARILLGKQPLNILDERVNLQSFKTRLSDYPKDAISWVEQARIYTSLGQRKKAYKSILVALHLAPADRFVVRAAIRFFVHYNEWHQAHRIATRAYSLNPDPLIFGPLLSVATHIKKLPHKTKAIAEHALSSPHTFLHSETLEAFGTLETMSGADQPSRKFFKRAWIDPTRAVIGHSQWVLRERLPGLAADRKFEFSQSNEALSWLRFAFLDFRGAMVSTNAWALEESYSRSPYILGSIAACHAEDFPQAIEICRRGLRSNPKDEILINNLVFALLRKGDAVSARKEFTPLRHLVDLPSHAAPAATYGLMLMCEGKKEAGYEYYGQAIKRALDAGNRRLALRATLNFMISTLDTEKAIDAEILKTLIKAIPQYQDPGCIGAAMAIGRRLKSANFSTAPELAIVAKEFNQMIDVEASKYRASIQSKFIDVPVYTPPTSTDNVAQGMINTPQLINQNYGKNIDGFKLSWPEIMT